MEGRDTLTGQADIDQGYTHFVPDDADLLPAEHPGTEFGSEQVATTQYPDIKLAPIPGPTKTVLSDGSDAPVINLSKDRIANILANEPAIFEIANSSSVIDDEPWYAVHSAGYWAVWVHQELIEHEARLQGVDPNLVKAIMYVENAHGASYGWIPESIGAEKTTLPMNINPDTWGNLVGIDRDLDDPFLNVRAGTILIQRIQQRIQNPTVAKVASSYKFTGREQVSDYGARVARVYESRVWEKVPPGFANPSLNQTPTRKAYLDEFRRRREELGSRLDSREAE